MTKCLLYVAAALFPLVSGAATVKSYSWPATVMPRASYILFYVCCRLYRSRREYVHIGIFDSLYHRAVGIEIEFHVAHTLLFHLKYVEVFIGPFIKVYIIHCPVGKLTLGKCFFSA